MAGWKLKATAIPTTLALIQILSTDFDGVLKVQFPLLLLHFGVVH